MLVPYTIRRDMKKIQKEAKLIEKLQESAQKQVQHAHGGKPNLTQVQPVIQLQRRHQSR
jgi:hypothetical protein